MARVRGEHGSFVPQDVDRPCERCGKSKPEVKFGSYRGYRRSLCTPCFNSDVRQRYADDDSRSRATARRCAKARYDKIRVLLREYKRMCGCYHCGTIDPLSLDYHHNDPAEKSFNLGKVGPSMSRVLDEISKCTVMCANCHRRVTAGEV